jgi:multimeric flavodoxin WrbA
MSKVLLLNGSSRREGNTAIALSEVAAALEGHGIETETLWLGNKPVNDCLACGACSKLDGKCVIDNDMVNELIAKAAESDAFVFGTPVYYAHPSGRIQCVLDRAFCAGGKHFAHKPAAAIAVARRGGTSASFDVINKYFTINQMPIVSSTYWNSVHGRTPGEAAQDGEGLQTMRNIAHNMAWLLQCIEAGKAAGIEAPQAERGTMTNFIR